jgi:HK97 family phage major capsid protein
MPPTLEELREQRNDAATKADEILKRDDVTGDELERSDELLGTVEDLDKRIQVLERNDRAQTRLKEPRPEPKLADIDQTRAVDSTNAYNKAFRKFLRGGTRALDTREFETLQTGFTDLSGESRALGTATGGAGGYTIPAEFQRKVTETMVAFGGMRQVANVISTDTGAALPWPGNNDTANLGAILDENTAMSELDVAFTTNTLGAFMYVSGMVRVSYQLLQDTFFDLEGFLARKLGERIGRIQNRHFTIGVDTTQPQGIVVGGTSGVTAASATAVTFPELAALKQSVNSAYRDGGNSKWMMNDTTYGEISGLLDTTNRPLLQPDLTEGGAGRLLGYPIVINPDMPNTTTGQKAIAFGDFRAGYIIRDVRGIQMTRLDERYAEFLQVAFFAYARADGGVDDAAAYRLITMA